MPFSARECIVARVNGHGTPLCHARGRNRMCVPPFTPRADRTYGLLFLGEIKFAYACLNLAEDGT